MKSRLSICIPTYNREPFLKVLLDSIISQANPDEVQIAISDNASSDQTKKLVENIRMSYPNIIYFRWQENMGADINYLKAVEISNGDYCWLMGSDDLIPSGAIKNMLARLRNADIYLVGRTEVTFHLKKIQDFCWLKEDEPDQEFDFSSNDEIIRYFSACRSIGGLFSYLSSIIVKRASWNKFPCDNEIIGTLYSHAYVLLKIVMNKGRLYYTKQPLVVCRSSNDSFFENGVQRGLIDLRGYHILGNKLINDTKIRQKFWNVMHYQCRPLNLIKSKAMSGWKEWPEYKLLAHNIYLIPRWVTLLAEILFPPARAAFLIKKLHKKIKN
jgi:abequosyltransferase